VEVSGHWSDSCPGPFTPGERAAGTHWIGGGPKAAQDAVAKRNNHFPPPAGGSSATSTHRNWWYECDFAVLPSVSPSVRPCERIIYSIYNMEQFIGDEQFSSELNNTDWIFRYPIIMKNSSYKCYMKKSIFSLHDMFFTLDLTYIPETPNLPSWMYEYVTCRVYSLFMCSFRTIFLRSTHHILREFILRLFHGEMLNN